MVTVDQLRQSERQLLGWRCRLLVLHVEVVQQLRRGGHDVGT
jgi:hypothetical protein